MSLEVVVLVGWSKLGVVRSAPVGTLSPEHPESRARSTRIAQQVFIEISPRSRGVEAGRSRRMLSLLACGNTSTAQNVCMQKAHKLPRPPLPTVRRRIILVRFGQGTRYDSLPAPFELVRLDWAEVLVDIKAEAPSTVVVLDPMLWRCGEELDPRVRELRQIAPLIPIVALLPLEDQYTQTARDLLSLGVTEFADVRFERNGDALLPALLRAHAQPFKRRLEQALTINLSLNALTLIRAAAQVAVDQGNAVELSRLFAARERTVAGWCSREGLPAPRRLLAWMRILLALLLLEEPHRSILGVARGSGFASDHPLRRALRELLGGERSISPRERKFCDAADLLNAELRGLREKAHRAKRQDLLV